MDIQAERILNAFRIRKARAGSFIHFTDFGEAIVWHEGYIRDEPVREALRSLLESGYIEESLAGITLALSVAVLKLDRTIQSRKKARGIFEGRGFFKRAPGKGCCG
jgi:hypothetical protein